jgi:hypothetical protein
VNRCEYSTIAWYSSGGNQWLGEHLGQPEQPRPEFVALTIAPMATSRNVVAVAAIAIARSRRSEERGLP